jgi:hypothetical protein
MRITPEPTPEEAEAIRATLETVRSQRAAAAAATREPFWSIGGRDAARRPPEAPVHTVGGGRS